MKKIINLFSILAIVSLFAISSCNDDEPTNTSLTGTWLETNYTASGCADPLDNETYNCDAPDCETLIITETTIDVDGDIFTYTKSGSTLTVNLGSGLFIIVTYSISGNILTITIQDSVADGSCKYVTKYKKV